jgi:hypothetical protein
MIDQLIKIRREYPVSRQNLLQQAEVQEQSTKGVNRVCGEQSLKNRSCFRLKFRNTTKAQASNNQQSMPTVSGEINGGQVVEQVQAEFHEASRMKPAGSGRIDIRAGSFLEQARIRCSRTNPRWAKQNAHANIRASSN